MTQTNIYTIAFNPKTNEYTSQIGADNNDLRYLATPMAHIYFMTEKEVRHIMNKGREYLDHIFNDGGMGWVETAKLDDKGKVILSPEYDWLMIDGKTVYQRSQEEMKKKYGKKEI
jgi:hypothetical protein